MANYKDAGVDVEAGYEAVRLMKEHVNKTFRKEVLTGLGGCSSSNDRALNAIRSGLPAKEVAEQCGISVRRVYQIAQSMGDENPYATKRPRLPRVAALPEVE